jgi:uncharacterized membrane protein YeaQ/YmgE (transglycosylase-associated protein family)
MEPSKRMEMLSSDVSREPFEDDRRREGLSVSDAASKAKSGIKDAAKVTGSGIKDAAKATGSGLKKATNWVGNILGKFGRYIKWICCILIVVCIGFIISKIVQLAKDAGAVATGIGSAVGAVGAVAASAVAMSRKRDQPTKTDDIVMPPPPSLSDIPTAAVTTDAAGVTTDAAANFEADAAAEKETDAAAEKEAANAANAVNAIAPGKDMLAADMVSDAVAANNALVTDALAANNRLVTAALPQPDAVEANPTDVAPKTAA